MKRKATDDHDSERQQPYTLVNVFHVAPEDQQALVEATEQTMRHLPGFISANIHRSYDAGSLEGVSALTYDVI